MRKFLLLLSSLSATSMFAQDVIVKKDNTTILSKVIEIGTSEIKYKKYSNQNGPTYSISKSEVQAINYENGEKETFTDADIPKSGQYSYYDSQREDRLAEGIAAGNRLQKERLLASAKSWYLVGDVWGTLCIIGGLASAWLVEDKSLKFTVGGIALGNAIVGAIICNAIAGNKRKAASAIASTPIIRQSFNLGESRLSAGIDLMNDRISGERAFALGISVDL